MKVLLKRTVLFALALVLLVTFAVGCSKKEKPEQTTSATTKPAKTQAGEATQATGQQEETIDISKHVDLVMVLIGDTPPDKELVYGELNKLIERDLNASLKVEFLPWADYEQKYPLMLAVGEEVDLIYTSPWCFYTQEATKGAFVEITEDILKKYMPMTWELQPKVSFEQAKIGGKTYFVPATLPSVSGSAVLIRADLREKYNIPELNSLEVLEQYFTAVAENEDGVFPFAAAGNNDQLKNLAFIAKNKIIGINGATGFGYIYKESGVTADSVQFLYDMPEYLEYAKLMKEWAEKGFWSRNAIANQTQPRDAFENGTSASLIWNLGTLGNTARKIEAEHPDWKWEICDVVPDAIHTYGLYTGDGMAVPASSNNKERAFMLLDKLKWEKEYYELIRFGVEDTHWIAVGENQWEPGPAQDKYVFGSYGTWGLKNQLFERQRADALEVETKMNDRWKEVADKTNDVFQGFIFDDTNVKNEIAALDAIIKQYVYILDLGLVEDVEAILNEFRQKAVDAGKDKIYAELRSQLEAYLANR